MGISTSAKLIVGCNYKELAATLDDDEIEDLNECLYEYTVNYASPYYDADREKWFVGYEVSKQTSFDKLGFLVGEINVATNSFISKFGKDRAHLIKISACADVM